MENYIIQFLLIYRRNLAKFRISAHNLAIETGRYTRPIKTPIENRKCFHCGQIEDEFHMIFYCDLYNDERCNLARILSDSTILTLIPSEDNACNLMSCMNGDFEVGKAICEFINDCFSKRSKILSIKKENEIYLRPLVTVTNSGRLSKRPTRLDL